MKITEGQKVTISDEAVKDSNLFENKGTVINIFTEPCIGGDDYQLVNIMLISGKSITVGLHEIIGIPLTPNGVAKYLMSDPQAYNEFIEIMLVKHLQMNDADRIYWSAWFEGAKGKDLENADDGIPFEALVEVYSFYSSFFDSIECKPFTNTELSVTCLDIIKNGNRIGSMVSIELPDTDDSIAVTQFQNEVEDWLIENE